MFGLISLVLLRYLLLFIFTLQRANVARFF